MNTAPQKTADLSIMDQMKEIKRLADELSQMGKPPKDTQDDDIQTEPEAAA